MASKLFKVSVFIVVLILPGFVFSQTPPSSIGRDRIIRADRPDSHEFEDDEAPAIEIVYVAVGSKQVEINQAFSSDENWLRNLKIGIRNVSPHTLTCVGIAFGLLAELDTKLKIHESWPWGISYYRGDCFPGQKPDKSLLGQNTTKTLRLRRGEQVVLDFSDVPRLYLHGDLFRKMSWLAKAVIGEDSLVRFKGRKPVELRVGFSGAIRFLDDDSY